MKCFWKFAREIRDGFNYGGLPREKRRTREGFNFFHTDSPTNAGGAASYIASNLKAAPKPDVKFDIALVESCWAEIEAGEGKKIIICCIYKHPLVILNSFATY